MSNSPLNTSFQFIFNNSFSNNKIQNNNENNKIQNSNNNNNSNNQNLINSSTFNNSNNQISNQSFFDQQKEFNSNNEQQEFSNIFKKNSDFAQCQNDNNLSIFNNEQGIDALKQFFEVLSKQNLTQKNSSEQQQNFEINNLNKDENILNSLNKKNFYEPIQNFEANEENAKENDNLDSFLEKAFINETQQQQSNFRCVNQQKRFQLLDDVQDVSNFLSDSEDILDIKKQRNNDNNIKNVVQKNFEFDDEKDDVFAPFEFSAQLRDIQQSGEKQKQNLAIEKEELAPFNDEDFSVDAEIQFEAIDLEEIQKKARALKKLQQTLPNQNKKDKQRGRLKEKQIEKANKKLNQNLIDFKSDSEDDFLSENNNASIQFDSLSSQDQNQYPIDIRILQATQKLAQEKRQKDYDKNICRYLARSIIRCITSQCYQAQVLSICQEIINIFTDDKAKQNSPQLKNYFDQVLGIDFQNIEKKEQFSNQTVNLSFKIYQRCYDYLMQQLESVTGHRAYANLLTYNDEERLVEKMILRKFSSWFLKKRALRYILNGNMKDKQSYINYKNKIMIYFINQPEAWTSNIVRVRKRR